jgi:hypothetical protein
LNTYLARSGYDGEPDQLSRVSQKFGC